jgi:hypothetical protein
VGAEGLVSGGTAEEQAMKMYLRWLRMPFVFFLAKGVERGEQSRKLPNGIGKVVFDVFGHLSSK